MRSMLHTDLNRSPKWKGSFLLKKKQPMTLNRYTISKISTPMWPMDSKPPTIPRMRIRSFVSFWIILPIRAMRASLATACSTIW